MGDPYDVVVVGGGIIAAAAGQHLAAAGYRTLLAERDDYGAATSSRTSRLQHCGLGYFSPASHSIGAFLFDPGFALRCLELSRRAMRGRNEFVLTSPERVRKLEFLVPLYDSGSISSWKARLAFRLMESFDPGGLPLEFTVLEPNEARRIPMIAGLRDVDRLRAVVRFAEYQFVWPERIVVDTIMKARDIGLEALNHTAVSGIERTGDGWEVVLTGSARTPRTVRTKAIVNAAGVWVDQITRLAAAAGPVLNAGAKGTNIAVRLPAEYRGCGLETIMRDGSPFYVIPWGDLHYVGPKDSAGDGSAEGFRAAEDEIAAILSETNAAFPGLWLKRTDVLYSWAGVRPRTAAPGERLGGMDTREHDLTDRGLPNFFVFTGGLLMTHRDAGRRLTAAVRRRLTPSGREAPIDYSTRLVPGGEDLSSESVAWCAEHEQIETLADLLRRRLPVGWGEDLGLSRVDEAAALCRNALGWSSARAAEEIAIYRRDVLRNFQPQEQSH
jgi:glycerol-3-phosphate dehydrogenase